MKLRHLLAALLLGALPVTAAHAGVFISIAPPPLVTYEQPLCPTDGYLWSPGYWAYDYDAGDYYWVSGAWVPPPRVGYLWTPGYWAFNDGGYVFNDGYWGPTVGFYGGINYGYGYGGYGYYGGRWEGRSFRYNTAISRVNTRVVRNTYVDRNAVRNTTSSRTSFNGGRGGIGARPDAAQLAASRGSHLRATSAQANVLKQARTTRERTVGGPAGRNRTAGVTRDPRTANLARNGRTPRNTPAFTNAPQLNGRTVRTNSARGGNIGGPRTAFARNPGIVRTQSPQFNRGPQVARGPQVSRGPQPKVAKPQGGQKNDKGKKH